MIINHFIFIFRYTNKHESNSVYRICLRLFTGTLIVNGKGSIHLAGRCKCKISMNFARSSGNDKIQIKGQKVVIKTVHTD